MLTQNAENLQLKSNISLLFVERKLKIFRKFYKKFSIIYLKFPRKYFKFYLKFFARRVENSLRVLQKFLQYSHNFSESVFKGKLKNYFKVSQKILNV